MRALKVSVCVTLLFWWTILDCVQIKVNHQYWNCMLGFTTFKFCYYAFSSQKERWNLWKVVQMWGKYGCTIILNLTEIVIWLSVNMKSHFFCVQKKLNKYMHSLNSGMLCESTASL